MSLAGAGQLGALKVAVNIHCLHPPLTGIGHYARNLLLRLLADERVEALAGVSHSGWHSREQVARIVSHSRGYAPRGLPGPSAWPRRLARRLGGGLPGMGHLLARASHRLQAGQRRRYRDFIYWEPNYLLLPIANPALATVHDLSHLRFPEYHPRARLAELRRLPDSLRRARKVATVSEFTRRELADFFQMEPASIALVPPAVSPLFRRHGERETAAARGRYGLPRQFVLHVGTIEPRKNLPRLLRAFCGLPAELRRRYKLVLAGGEGWHGREFADALAGVDARDVMPLGYVRREHLPALFSAATLLAYPSLYEGFGMPVLEAMASGTAVLAADAASLPEVAAGAAHLVDPLSSEDMRLGLCKVLQDEDYRRDLRRRGREVAARHSWSRSADQLIRALQAIAASPRRGEAQRRGG